MRIIQNKTKKCVHRGNDGTILFAMNALYQQLLKSQGKNRTDAEEEAVWRDAAYVQDFVGISERTLYRYQLKGMLGTVRKENGKRLFLETAILRFKRKYWNI